MILGKLTIHVYSQNSPPLSGEKISGVTLFHSLSYSHFHHAGAVSRIFVVPGNLTVKIGIPKICGVDAEIKID